MAKSSINNKNHWYDGAFYDYIIAPNQTKLFNQIKQLISKQSTVLDVGCGTGYLPFLLADKCISITGIDLSKRNIDKANQNLLKYKSKSSQFVHTPIEFLNSNSLIRYDYATITYVVHEIDEKDRLPLLESMFRVANIVIISDYLTPQPHSFSGFITKIVEFIAGKSHYRNFKNFQRNNGLNGIIEKGNYELITEIINDTNRIVVLKKI